MKTWEPSFTVCKLIVQSRLVVRGYHAEELLKTATFKLAGPIATLFGMTGITFRPNCIVLSRELCASKNTAWQARVVFHELVHVAQQLDLGMATFKADYIWQWICAGGSYKNLKKYGLEKEAYEWEENFARIMDL